MTRSEAPLWRRATSVILLAAGGLTVADHIPGVNPWDLFLGKDKVEQLRPQIVESVPDLEFMRREMQAKGKIEVAGRNYTLNIHNVEKKVKVLGVEFPSWIAGEKAEGTIQMWAQTRTDFSTLPIDAFSADKVAKILTIIIPRLEIGDVGIYGPDDPNAPKGEKTDIQHRRGVLNGNIPDMIDEQVLNGKAQEALRLAASGDSEFLEFSRNEALRGFTDFATNLLRSTGNEGWNVKVRVADTVSAQNPDIELGRRVQMEIGKEKEKANVTLRTNGLPQLTKELNELASTNLGTRMPKESRQQIPTAIARIPKDRAYRGRRRNGNIDGPQLVSASKRRTG